jgi:hypothetical protein
MGLIVSIGELQSDQADKGRLTTGINVIKKIVKKKLFSK